MGKGRLPREDKDRDRGHGPRAEERPRSPDHHSHDQGSSPHPVPHLMAAALEGAESAVQKKDLVLGGHYHAGEGRTWFMGELRERAVGRIN